MPAYIVGIVRVTDPARFADYQKAIAGLSEKFGGESVTKGLATTIEGEAAAGERVIVSRYPNADAARAYIQSPEYRSAAALREGAAEVVLRLVEA